MGAFGDLGDRRRPTRTPSSGYAAFLSPLHHGNHSRLNTPLNASALVGLICSCWADLLSGSDSAFISDGLKTGKKQKTRTRALMETLFVLMSDASESCWIYLEATLPHLRLHLGLFSRGRGRIPANWTKTSPAFLPFYFLPLRSEDER